MSKTKIKIFLFVLIVVVASVAYVTANRRASRASVVATTAESPQPCDLEAAHPADPQRLAPGKSDKEIVPLLAIRACTESTTQFPSYARFQFQLGRGLLAMKRTEEAAKAFTAASGEYPPANFYLAEMKLDSYWQTESPEDIEEAKELLAKAADSFSPAAERLGQITFDPNAFSSPRLVQALWDEDFQSLNKARLLVAIYAKGLNSSLGMEFHPSDQGCPAYVVDPTIVFGLDRAIAGDPRNTLEGAGYVVALKAAEYAGTLVWDPVWKGNRDKWVEYYEGLGKRDGLFIAHHLGCESPVTAQLYRNLVRFSKEQRPLSEYAEGMLRGGAKDLFSKPDETTAQVEE